MTTTNEQIRERIEEQAWDDYHTALGSIIEVHYIDCYVRDSDDTNTITLDPPCKCRVEPTDRSDVLRWLDTHLDPVWNVQPLEQRAELVGTRSWWVFGPSYRLTDGQREPGSYEREQP